MGSRLWALGLRRYGAPACYRPATDVHDYYTVVVRKPENRINGRILLLTTELCENRIDGRTLLLAIEVYAPPHAIDLGQGPGIRVQGSGFSAQGVGCRVQGSGSPPHAIDLGQGTGIRVQGAWFRV